MRPQAVLTAIRITLPYLTLPYLTLPYLTLPYLTLNLYYFHLIIIITLKESIFGCQLDLQTQLLLRILV